MVDGDVCPNLARIISRRRVVLALVWEVIREDARVNGKLELFVRELLPEEMEILVLLLPVATELSLYRPPSLCATSTTKSVVRT